MWLFYWFVNFSGIPFAYFTYFIYLPLSNVSNVEEQRVSWNIHSDIHNLHVPLAAIDPIDALFCFSKLLAGLKNDGVWFWLQSLTFTLLIWICSWKSRYRFSQTLSLWQNQYCMYFSIEIHTGGFSWTLKGFSNTLFFFLSFFWYKEGFTAFNFIDNKMLNSARVMIMLGIPKILFGYRKKCRCF